MIERRKREKKNMTGKKREKVQETEREKKVQNEFEREKKKKNHKSVKSGCYKNEIAQNKQNLRKIRWMRKF